MSIKNIHEEVLSRPDFSGDALTAADEKVLSGTLKKKKAGKVIAESKVEFTWESDD